MSLAISHPDQLIFKHIFTEYLTISFSVVTRMFTSDQLMLKHSFTKHCNFYLFLLSLAVSHPYQLLVKHSCTTHCKFICFSCHSQFHIRNSWWSNIHLLNIITLIVFCCHSQFLIRSSWCSNINLLNIVSLSVSFVTLSFTLVRADGQIFI